MRMPLLAYVERFFFLMAQFNDWWSGIYSSVMTINSRFRLVFTHHRYGALLESDVCVLSPPLCRPFQQLTSEFATN